MADFTGSQGYSIDIEKGKVVSYSLVSQTDEPQEMQIKLGDKLIVETSVKSKNLSNTSTGTFTADGGSYKVIFNNAKTVKVDEAVINAKDYVVTKTYLFAGEETGKDNDYQDAFATLTWFRQAG